MAGYVETPVKSFPNNAALSEGLRVVLSGGYLAAAGAGDIELGTMEERSFSTDTAAPVRLRNAQGTRRMIANAAISQYAAVYAAASGKVAPSGPRKIGIALTAAGANNDVLEVLPIDDVEAGAFAATPAAAEGAGNMIPAGATAVAVGAVTNDANDFIVLPPIADVPIGHQIVIACNAGSNFELRTPASSGTKINDVDSDGTQEHLCTDTHLIVVRKHTATGWVAQSLTKLGAVVTAVVPD
ncbi:MAG: hypothetical protein JNK76_20550 [Planctomycetales bacterium]|nr:hypothetical protein [Planctomycetales bacterium]